MLAGLSNLRPAVPAFERFGSNELGAGRTSLGFARAEGSLFKSCLVGARRPDDDETDDGREEQRDDEPGPESVAFLPIPMSRRHTEHKVE